jgi:hypothetical protein
VYNLLGCGFYVDLCHFSQLESDPVLVPVISWLVLLAAAAAVFPVVFGSGSGARLDHQLDLTCTVRIGIKINKYDAQLNKIKLISCSSLFLC